jgi:hypothetical protein
MVLIDAPAPYSDLPLQAARLLAGRSQGRLRREHLPSIGRPGVCFNFPVSENSIEWLRKEAGIWIVQEGL